MKKKSKVEYAPVTVETKKGRSNIVYFNPEEAKRMEPKWIRLWYGEKVVLDRKPKRQK